MTSQLTCPACQQPLQKDLRPGLVSLWCGNASRCPSEAAANDGAEGATEQAAFDNLKKLIAREEDEQPLGLED